MNVENNRMLILLSAGLVLVTSVAGATTITSEAKTVVAAFSEVFPECTTEWSHTFRLPQFDPALGTLESVRLSASQTMRMSGTIQNNSTGQQNFSVRAGSLLTVDLPGSFGFLQPSPLAVADLYNLPSGGTAPYGPINAADSADYTYTLPADLAWFIGPGTFTLPGFTQTQEIILGGGGNVWVLLNTLAGASVEVEYTYSASKSVPEASTFLDVALLLILPFGASALRRLTQPRRVPCRWFGDGY